MVERQARLKFVLLGSSACGKTAFLTRFVSNEYHAVSHWSTGASFDMKTISIGNKAIFLEVWDTNGCDAYLRLGELVYRSASCCLLMFDITDSRSFQKAGSYRAHFFVTEQPPKAEQFPFILVGLKAEIEANRQVSWNEAQSWACIRNMPYIEASSKDNRNLNTVFEVAGRLALAYIKNLGI